MNTSSSGPSSADISFGGCQCVDCDCGPNCQCTEQLCLCQASSVLGSLGQSRPVCCSGRSNPVHVEEQEGETGDPLLTASSTDSFTPTETAVLDVQGMTCGMCSQSIERSLATLGGVVSGKALHVTDEVVVVFRPEELNGEAIKEQIEAIGYDVTNWKLIGQPDDVESSPTPAQKREISLEVDGMTCSMCVHAVEGAIKQLSPNLEVTVDLSTDTAKVCYNLTETINIDDIRNVIEDVGYDVKNVKIMEKESGQSNNGSSAVGEANEGDDPADHYHHFTRRQAAKVRRQGRAFAWSCLGAAPILLITMVLPHVLSSDHVLYRHVMLFGRPFQIQSLIILCLATPVQFIAGWSFYHMAYFNILSGRLGMDVLVALGTSASYGYAVLGLLDADDQSSHFMETSASLICFVLLGKFLQSVAVRRTSQALTQLMKLQAKTAVVVTPAERSPRQTPFDPLTHPIKETEVPIAQVQATDIVKIMRGSLIPADGVVIAGDISVDESMVTGESLPLHKSPGSVVLGGTTCVDLSGVAFLRVTGVGSKTALAQIVTLIQEAQRSAVPIQTFADRISAIFVPTVISIATVTYMVWFALCSSKVVPPSWYEEHSETITTFSLKFAIACLVISCPCALGLATPTAVMVGTGVGAKVGVLLKGGEALEIASTVDSVIFDKTGTLTIGKPVITDWIYEQRCEQDCLQDNETHERDLLWKLASLERTSEHPLAEAVVKYAETELGNEYLNERPFVQPGSFKSRLGRGASGVVDGANVAIGNRAFLANDIGAAVTTQAEEAMRKIEEDGKTAILAATDGVVQAVLGIADQLRPDAIKTLEYLRNQMNVDIWMVTGDNQRTAMAIGTRLRIPSSRIISEALPAAKVQKVRELQNEGRIVAMVGDGVNDSPALAQADVGISVGTGADIASEAADMVLVKGNVSDLCVALHLSRAIFRRIQLNFLWALIYNCLGIPIAAGMFYPYIRTRLPPTVAAVAMALSSISVVLSSLSLQLYRPPDINQTSRRRSRRSTSTSMAENELTIPLLPSDALGNSGRSEETQVAQNRTSTSVQLEEGSLLLDSE